MKYSVTVEYALHSLVYLLQSEQKQPIGIKDLAAFQGLSETYLSKAFSKLAKAGIVVSVPGVKGGYILAKAPEDISFWDVIRAIEGPKPIFQCQNILKSNQLYKDDEACQTCTTNTTCTINQVMLEAEGVMKDFLKMKTLAWLSEELGRVLPKENMEKSKTFFNYK